MDFIIVEEHRGRPLAEHLIARIQRLYRENRPISEIARLTGVDRHTVYVHVGRPCPSRRARQAV